jgi:hypothetical protein
VVCEQVAGTIRCVVCSKAKQSCLYHLSDAGVKGNVVAPLRDAAEESPGEEEEEDEEEEEEEEEKEKKGPSPLVKVFRKVTSPLKTIGKRKATELSHKSVLDREAEPSQRARERPPSTSSSADLPDPSMGSSSFYSNTMPPPPLTGSTGLGIPSDPFYVRRLEVRLRESQEDITTLLRRHESRESLLLEEIAMLKDRLGEGSVSGSGRRGGAGGSSGRY